jgi:hypothetical protein
VEAEVSRDNNHLRYRPFVDSRHHSVDEGEEVWSRHMEYHTAVAEVSTELVEVHQDVHRHHADREEGEHQS